MYDFLINPPVRVALFLVVLILVFLLPWFVSIPVVVFFTLYLPSYFEVLFLGFLFDSLYAERFSFPYYGLTIAFVFISITLFVKDRIRT